MDLIKAGECNDFTIVGSRAYAASTFGLLV